jgi:hypothetical protein
MGSCIRDTNFVLFVVNGLIKGETEKLSGQYLGFICDESLTCPVLNSNLGHFGSFNFIPCFMWRITFVCLIVCKW